MAGSFCLNGLVGLRPAGAGLGVYECSLIDRCMRVYRCHSEHGGQVWVMVERLVGGVVWSGQARRKKARSVCQFLPRPRPRRPEEPYLPLPTDNGI